ncbi:MAG TPA: hypothetical protein VJ461_04970 [Candidatus Nanoarchaeia archaeon]|nr:hypothetical protein [Candidatus Nanoarchaeia archaeon]
MGKKQPRLDAEQKKIEERERLEEEAMNKVINLSRDHLCVLSQIQLNGPARLEDLSLTSPKSVNIEGLLIDLQIIGLVDENDGVYSSGPKKYDQFKKNYCPSKS